MGEARPEVTDDQCGCPHGHGEPGAPDVRLARLDDQVGDAQLLESLDVLWHGCLVLPEHPSQVFVARGGVAELTPTILTADGVRDLVEKMLKSSGRRVDLSSPFVDAMLPDGSRLHVVIPDIARNHWHVNIRKFVVRASHLDDLVRLGTLTPQAARFLEAAVSSGLNVLVAGGTQAGVERRYSTGG